MRYFLVIIALVLTSIFSSAQEKKSVSVDAVRWCLQTSDSLVVFKEENLEIKGRVVNLLTLDSVRTSQLAQDKVDSTKLEGIITLEVSKREVVEKDLNAKQKKLFWKVVEIWALRVGVIVLVVLTVM